MTEELFYSVKSMQLLIEREVEAPQLVITKQIPTSFSTSILMLLLSLRTVCKPQFLWLKKHGLPPPLRRNMGLLSDLTSISLGTYSWPSQFSKESSLSYLFLLT